MDPDDIIPGLRLGEVGVWRWRIEGEALEWTENLEAIHRMEPGSFDGTLESFRRDLHPEDAEAVWLAITRSIETGEPYAVVYRSALARANRPVWIEAKGGVFHGRNGERYLTGVCRDVTASVSGKKDLEKRFTQQKGIQELGSYALGDVSLNDIMDKAVETAAQVFDVPLAKILQFVDSADELKLVSGTGWNEGLVGKASVGIDLDSQAGYTLTSSRPVIVSDLTVESRFSGPALLRDHGVRSGMSVVIAGASDRPFGVFGIHDRDLRTFDEHDVDALISIANIVAQGARQHEANERQRLILREMAHRSGNLLQVVASLASQTFRTHSDPATALQSFISRLESLSRANQLITRSGWSNMRFRSLIEEVLGLQRDRLEIRGRDIRLPADLAFDMALVLYELATNSLKYGGLSTPGGKVSLTWHIEPAGEARIFHLDWSDSEKVAKKISGTGFGSRLKHALVEQKWRGTMTVEMEGPYRFSCAIPLQDES
ncbi:sensor histidine kinase [Zhengella sp. ZM62]|uniref:sensor histidine kinase n=1 Tax=Zhengella sedimenti TaxID=3390035 RepID=UPI00397633DA